MARLFVIPTFASADKIPNGVPIQLLFFTLALISIACEHRREKRRPEIRLRSQAVLAVKGFTKGAFHLSGLDGRTIARPVNLKIK